MSESDESVEFVSQTSSLHSETAALLAQITGSPKPKLPPDDELRRVLAELLATADLSTVTPRWVREELERRYSVSLLPKMGMLREEIRAFVNKMQEDSESEQESEESSSEPDDEEESASSSASDSEEDEEEWSGDGTKAKTKKATPKKATPKKATPKKATPKKASPKLGAVVGKGKAAPATSAKNQPMGATKKQKNAVVKGTPPVKDCAVGGGTVVAAATTSTKAARGPKPAKGEAMPLVMTAPTTKRDLTLLAQLRTPVDLASEHGQVGQIKVESKRALSISLKGENFRASLVPCTTLMVVNASGAEAKVEGCFNSYLMAAHTGNQFEAMDATVTAGSFNRSGFVVHEEDVNRGGGSDSDAEGGGAGSKRKKGSGSAKGKKARK